MDFDSYPQKFTIMAAAGTVPDVMSTSNAWMRDFWALGGLTALDDLVESSLRDVDLWDTVKDRLPQKATMLTLEQQQKLCIARLLPLKPRVILMDEPCSALDAKGTAAIERLMDDMRGKFTILIVTHNMAQARRISEECIFMLMGEVVEHAPTTSLFLKPSRKETEMYVEGRYG